MWNNIADPLSRSAWLLILNVQFKGKKISVRAHTIMISNNILLALDRMSSHHEKFSYASLACKSRSILPKYCYSNWNAQSTWKVHRAPSTKQEWHISEGEHSYQDIFVDNNKHQSVYFGGDLPTFLCLFEGRKETEDGGGGEEKGCLFPPDGGKQHCVPSYDEANTNNQKTNSMCAISQQRTLVLTSDT